MTDLPNDPLDELASAHLDGLTSPEEDRRIEGDPALGERVARLRAAARDAVRLPDAPADPERRELAIAAALAAFDDPALAPVTTLADVRTRRTPTWVRWVAAAAAVAIAAVLVPRLVGDDDEPTTTLAAPGTSDDARTKAADSAPFQADASTGTGGDSSTALELAPDAPASAGATTTTAPNPAGGGGTTLALVDLGQVADLDALASAARAELDAGGAPVASPPADPAARDACLATVQVAGPDGTGTYVLNAVARVGEQDVIVTVTAEPTDARTLRVYAVGGCALVDTRAL